MQPSEIKCIQLNDGSTLTIVEVVREVPNKRVVCAGMWQGQAVFAKVFFGKKAAQYALRDVGGVEALQRAKLLTPNMLKQCELSKLKAYIVIFKAIIPSDNAELVWSGASEFNRIKLAHKLVKLVAQHHEAGLIQTDMYLKNFLIQYDDIYTIDGDGIRKFDVLSKQKALANLSQLLSKFDVLLLDKHLPLLLNSYTDARGWPESPNLANIKLSIKLLRYKAAKAYADKKVYRQCTDVDVKKTGHGYFAVSSQYSSLRLPQTVSALDSCFTSENIIKDGNTCTVALSSIDGLNVVIKRYNIKTFWHGVSRAIRQTRASLSWANAHRLMLLGLATAKPIALIETRIWGLKREAYFLSEYVDAPDMTVFFHQTSSSTLRAHAVKQLVELFYRLYMLNISHGDMKATNIKVLSDGKPLLIDLDSMQQHRYDFLANKAHARDIKRFMQNWKEEPSLYNAFVKGFKVVYADHAPLQAAQILISL